MALSWKIDVVTPRLAFDKKILRAALRAGGNELAAATRALLKGGRRSGRFYRKTGGGMYQASAAGESPANRSGDLASKIKVRVFRGGLGVEVREQARYAWILEHGRNNPARKAARKQSKARGGKLVQVGISARMEPRPSISKVLDQRGASIAKRIQAAAALGIKFVRVPPRAAPP